MPNQGVSGPSQIGPFRLWFPADLIGPKAAFRAVKKHSVEQIIAKLREIEKLTGQGIRLQNRTAAALVSIGIRI